MSTLFASAHDAEAQHAFNSLGLIRGDDGEYYADLSKTLNGIAIGDKVRLTDKFPLCDEVQPGNIAIVTGIDDHGTFPFTVTVQKPRGQDIDSLPLKATELELAK